MSSDEIWIPAGNFHPRRYRPGGLGNWSGHLPFANDLVAEVQPDLFVELGTHYGESYFGFCQAVVENHLSCLCYAVDTWRGEPHAGYYDEAVYEEVSEYNTDNYSSFSYLLRSTFDEAKKNFSDDSIDILHIDGLHLYESVSHDFYTWLPKVKPGGVILLHDIVGRHGNFGVWTLWEELASLGLRFAFTHAWGLGVFQKPHTEGSKNRLLNALFHSSEGYQEHIRRFYSLSALRLEHEYNLRFQRRPSEGKVLTQIYPFGTQGYSAERVYNVNVEAGKWQRLKVDLCSGLGTGPLRIDFVEQPAVIDIAGIAIRKCPNDEVIWRADGSEELTVLDGLHDMSRVPISNTEQFCRFIAWSSDPQFLLPVIEEAAEYPVYLDAWVRFETDPSSWLTILRNALAAAAEEKPVTPAPKELEDLAALSAERDSLIVAHRRLQGELYVAKTDLKHSQIDLEHAQMNIEQLRKEVEQLLSNKVEELEQANRELQEKINGVLASRSWRLTEPLRAVAMRLRGRE
jgi:hypothetical protein